MWKVYVRKNLTNPRDGFAAEWRISAPVEYEPVLEHEKKPGVFETRDPEFMASNCTQVNALTAHEAKHFAKIVAERQRRIVRHVLAEFKSQVENL